MRITPLQGQVIAHLQFDAELPLKVLAKRLKVREHRLRYALDGLLRNGTMRRVPRLDLLRLGYTYMHVFFSVRATQRAVTKQLLAALTRMKGVVFLAELGGDFHYELIVAVKKPGQITNFFSGKLGELVTGHAISASRAYEFYPKNYLAREVRSVAEMSADYDCDVTAIDQLDDQVLRAITDPSCESLRDAARKSGLPFATLRLRVEKLRQKMVTGGFIYDVDPLDYGYNEFILLLYTRGLGASLEKELFSSARKNLNITHARSLIGEWNFEIGIEVQKAEDVVRVTEEYTEALSEEIIASRLMQRFRALHFRPYPF